MGFRCFPNSVLGLHLVSWSVSIGTYDISPATPPAAPSRACPVQALTLAQLSVCSNGLHIWDYECSSWWAPTLCLWEEEEEVVPRAGRSALRPLRPSPIGGLVENARLFGQGEFTGYSSGGLHRGKCMSRVSHRPFRGKAACFCAASLRNCYVSQCFKCFEEQRRRKMSEISGWESCLLTEGHTGQLSQGFANQQGFF